VTIDDAIDGVLASIPVVFGIVMAPVMWPQLVMMEQIAAVALYAAYLIGMAALLKRERGVVVTPGAASAPS